ncbi:hypothetical protein [uncultured Tateyamaria sp.]|nr:hypothetical protein [uncultured Tateyamaria sp.]
MTRAVQLNDRSHFIVGNGKSSTNADSFGAMAAEFGVPLSELAADIEANY